MAHAYDVRFGSLADILRYESHVRFTPMCGRLDVAQEAPKQGMQTIPSQRNLSPAATAAAPANANVSTGELMDCVTQSCKINCSPKVAPRFRPKWCANFKEPEPD
jgi:hypothetical protein